MLSLKQKLKHHSGYQSVSLQFTCSHHNSFHQFSGVEAGLDDVGTTVEGVFFMLIYIVAPGSFLASTGQTGLGDWHTLS